jgi:hypothetical protein
MVEKKKGHLNFLSSNQHSFPIVRNFMNRNGRITLAALLVSSFLGGCGGGGSSGSPSTQSPNISGGVEVRDASLGAGATVNLATFDLNAVGGKTLLALPTISSLTWPPAPANYGGKNHSLRVRINWKVLVNGIEKTHFSQTGEQNIIQLQGIDVPTTAGLKTITLQAVNTSYWSLDDPPYGTTPVGSNNFNILFSAVEVDSL